MKIKYGKLNHYASKPTDRTIFICIMCPQVVHYFKTQFRLVSDLLCEPPFHNFGFIGHDVSDRNLQL